MIAGDKDACAHEIKCSNDQELEECESLLLCCSFGQRGVVLNERGVFIFELISVSVPFWTAGKTVR